MVKRLSLFLFVFFLTVSGVSGTVKAQTYTVYSQGNISSTYVSYFDGITNNYHGYNYVIWRDSQYVYRMAIGEDLDYSNGVFTSSDCTVYSINTDYNYNQSYTLINNHDSSFSLSNNNHYIIYSNLGNNPNIYERGSNYESTLLITIIVALLFVLCRDILSIGKG